MPAPSYNACARILRCVEEANNEDDLVIVLVSGGGSALLPHPVPGLTLHEKTAIIKTLAAAGADIKGIIFA